MRKWHTFDRRAATGVGEALVTVQRRGTFSFNAAARAAIGEPEAVELLYDPDDRVIGFRPADPSLPHAYALRKQGGSNSWIIAGQAFTNRYGIPTDTALRYGATTEDGVLVVDLKTTGTDATGPRLKTDG